MNISDVAKKTGLTSKAIRFYEEKKRLCRISDMKLTKVALSVI